MDVRNLNTGTARRTKLGMALKRSAEGILAHVKGDAGMPARRIVLPDKVGVKRRSLAESIRRCIEPLGGVELAVPPREAVRRPSKLAK